MLCNTFESPLDWFIGATCPFVLARFLLEHPECVPATGIPSQTLHGSSVAVPCEDPRRRRRYYDFRALDRPLTKNEMAALRSISTRAAIAATFSNHYEWGDLKANPSKLLDRYFDAFVYIAHRGTGEFHIRLPQEPVDYKLVKAMVPGESLRVRKTATFGPGQLWTEGKRHSGRVGYTRVFQNRI